MEEIKSLIPDIEDKIADMRVYKEEVCVCREIVKHCLKPKLEQPQGEINKIEVRRAPQCASLEGAVENLKVDESDQ